MIKFQGEISKSFKSEIERKIKKKRTAILLIIGVLIHISFILPIHFAPNLRFFYAIIIMMFLCAITVETLNIVSIALIPSLHFPEEIIISNEKIIKESKATKTIIKTLEDVKKIIDYGEYYMIVFIFFKKDKTFICQKNLLIEGSLEEFEKLFENVLVKRIK